MLFLRYHRMPKRFHRVYSPFKSILNHLSDNTYSRLGPGSPLWKEMFAKGFKFRAIQDKNKSVKVAAIKAGGFSVPMTAVPDQDKAALEQAINTLTATASNGME